ncbi:MAG: CHASE sensor domain-containing protein, partial [Candidatus Hydrogenedentota bacterium]
MLQRFKDYSIKNKLALACVLTSMIALLVSTATFYIYEVRTLGSDIGRKYSDVVNTLAPEFSASIEFEDNARADEILSRLGQNPDVLSAAIYDADGALFASYVAPQGQMIPERWETIGESSRLDGDDLFVEEPILSKDTPTGVMVLHARISDLKERQLYYASLVAGVFGISLVAAVLFASLIVRYISRPIEELAATSRRISEERNYSLRAAKSTNDELGSLIDTFNEMLRQIQERDTKLEQRGVRLEGEVAFRTEEIQKLSQAVEQSPHTTVITNPQGLVEYVNQRFTDSTG